jgi:hypothetical protein
MESEPESRNPEISRKIGRNVLMFRQVEHPLNARASGAKVSGLARDVESGASCSHSRQAEDGAVIGAFACPLEGRRHPVRRPDFKSGWGR